MRVFVVGYLGDWRPAAAVLFERDSLCGNPAPSREAGKKIAGTIAASSFSGGASGRPEDAAGERHGVTFGIPGNWIGRQPENGGNSTQFMEEVAPCLTSADKHGVAHTFDMRQHHNPQPSDTAQLTTKNSAFVRGDTPLVAQPIGIFQDSEFGVQQYNTAGTLRAGRIPEHQMALQPIAFQLAGDRDNPSVSVSETAFCLPANPMSDRGQAVAASMAVRRLTPVECERLQGFPDGYTNIPWRKADQSPDGPRYKALGNSMAVPVMAWIGKRIEAKVTL